MSKRTIIVFIIMLFSGSFYGGVIDDLTNEISDKVFGPVATVISEELANHMGFYTGSGNMTAIGPAPFLGLKVGAGIGINMSYVLRQALKGDKSALTKAGTNPNAGGANKLSGAVAIFPFPYDMVYVKAGLPEMPLDIGLRVGYIPIPVQTSDDGVSFYANAFHLGAEGRYQIWNYYGDLVKVHGCASLDFNGGGLGLSYSNLSEAYVSNTLVGTNFSSMGMDIAWGGVSLGGKIMASVNIPVVGCVFTGLGVNLNLGEVSTKLSMNGTFRDLTATNFTINFGKTVPKGYNLLDIRFLFGFQLFFVSASLEYGFFNRDLALNLYPIALAF